MLKNSNFHGKAQGVINFSLLVCSSLVQYIEKFRKSQKDVAWKLPRDPTFKLLGVLSARKREASGQVIRLLLVPKALPGETYTPESLTSSGENDGC